MGSPTVNPEQSQYIKLPDGSYGKFRADAKDDEIRTAVAKDFPDAFKQPPASAGSRFWEGAKAGAGGENALNTKVDPAHPVSTNPMIPGAGVFRDIKSGNYAGAAGRVIGPAAILGASLIGAKAGEPVTEPNPINIGKVAGAPIRFAARSAEGLGNIPGVSPVLNTARNAMYINTPVEDIPKFKMPLRDFGLNKGAIPVPESVSPAAQQLQSRIQIERGLGAQEPFPRVSEGLPEVEEGQAAATEHLHKAIQPNDMRATSPPINTSRAKIGQLLEQATGGKPLAKGIPIGQQLDRVTPAAPKESSVIKSHSYDPNAQEMTITTHNGQTYVHGDVSPDQAKAFANADSKGKAWNDLRNSSTLVAKVKDGKRIAIKPTAPKSASPND